MPKNLPARRLPEHATDASEQCYACGEGWPSLEVHVTLDGDALCPLCAVEVVVCECDLTLQRRQLQASHSGPICPACASVSAASITLLDRRGRGHDRAASERRAA